MVLCVTAGTHTSSLSHAAPSGSGSGDLELLDFSPEWDFTLGGSKVIVTCREVDGDITSNCLVCIMFDKEQVGSYVFPWSETHGILCLQASGRP